MRQVEPAFLFSLHSGSVMWPWVEMCLELLILRWVMRVTQDWKLDFLTLSFLYYNIVGEAEIGSLKGIGKPTRPCPIFFGKTVLNQSSILSVSSSGVTSSVTGWGFYVGLYRSLGWRGDLVQKHCPCEVFTFEFLGVW